MDIELNPQFKSALKILEDTDDTCLLTGKAGTGKSTLLKYFREHTKKNIIVLAPTGVAALNVEGETIHSFFAIPPGTHPEEIKRKPLSPIKRKLIKKLDAIVIDEVSMVRSDIMDFIDIRLRQTLNSDRPFAGIQMIFIGDLYQLPPVLTNDEKDEFLQEYESQYFFSSNVMQQVDLRYIELIKIYRQQDKAFVDVLNRIRNNSATEQDMEFINARYEENVEEFLDNFTIYLATTNRIVDQVNAFKLAELSASKKEYQAQTTGNFPESAKPNPNKLELKTGSQIMFLNNEKDELTGSYKWVNGTLGKIIDIVKNTKEGAPDVLVVELISGEIVEVLPHTWDLEKYSFDQIQDKVVKNTVGSYTQYPVRLAWAVTIHKAQGKTFERLIIDLGNFVFDFGQTYVALSRATNLEGITLKRPVKLKDIKIDERVGQFISSLVC